MHNYRDSLERLQVEYQSFLNFRDSDALEKKRELERILETLENEYLKQQGQEHRLSEQKNRQYQVVLESL